MGLPGNPESGQNILMEPKNNPYIRTRIQHPMSGAVHMYVQYACIKPYVIFQPGKPMRFSGPEQQIWQLFSAVFLSLVTHKPHFEGLPYKVSPPT